MGKKKFYHFQSPPVENLWLPLEKKPLLASWKKSFQSPRSHLLSTSLFRRSKMGRPVRTDRWVEVEGADACRARHIHQSHTCWSTRNQERVRVSGLQEQVERPYLCLDFQPENQGNPVKVDLGWSCLAATSLDGQTLCDAFSEVFCRLHCHYSFSVIVVALGSMILLLKSHSRVFF